MQTPSGRFFENLPESAPVELFTTLIERAGVRVERIVSTGQASPEDFFYDQPTHEWVMVVRGEALLRFEDENAPRCLTPGDWVWIEAHRRHRVEWTSDAEPTVWLAIHVEEDTTPRSGNTPT